MVVGGGVGYEAVGGGVADYGVEGCVWCGGLGEFLVSGSECER